jgi:hypothetical protein
MQGYWGPRERTTVARPDNGTLHEYFCGVRRSPRRPQALDGQLRSVSHTDGGPDRISIVVFSRSDEPPTTQPRWDLVLARQNGPVKNLPASEWPPPCLALPSLPRRVVRLSEIFIPHHYPDGWAMAAMQARMISS